MTAASDNVAIRVGERLVRRARAAIDPLTKLSPDQRGPDSGWLAVTVLCEPQDLDAGAPPEPLAELGDRIEVDVRAAAGDKGFELRARLRPSSSGHAGGRLSGTDAEGDLRSALRRSKQLIEVGEVLRVDPAPHGERTSTPGGLLLEAWTRTAPKAGVR